MTQNFVRALARSMRYLASAAVILGVSASTLVAQGSTGKIEGTVQDAGGQPVANAQVRIVGTAFATTANPAGYYFFNSVPAGSYSIRVNYVGYKPQEITGFRVLSGQTVTLDVKLVATNVEIQEITVVAATNALVPRDKVATKQLINGAFTSQLPVDNLNAVLALQPGVVASTGGTQISVRGSRIDENTTYVDGVPVQSGNRGAGAGNALPTLSVAAGAFQDASVTTGAASAEFGNAQGGIIAITTRTGGQRFSGSVSYETSELSGKTMGGGFNYLQASLGGPIIGDLTFFVAGGMSGNRFGNFGYAGDEVPGWTAVGVDTTFAIPSKVSPTADTLFLPVYQYALSRGNCDAPYVAGAADPEIRNNYGYDCRGRLGGGGGLSTGRTLSGKLNYSFGSGSRIALSYLTSSSLNRGGRGISNTFGTTQNNQVVTLNWNQVLSRSSTRQIAIDAYISYQKDRYINSLLTRESEEATRDPFLGWYFGSFDYQYDEDNFGVTDELVKQFRLQDPNAPTTLYNRDLPTQYNSQHGYNGEALTIGSIGAFGGAAGNLSTSGESRVVGKANLDLQIDRYNRVKIGGEFTSSDMETYTAGATSNIGFQDIIKASPIRYNFFAEDRLDLGDVVLVAGVRYDYFKIDAEKWIGFPRISSVPGFTAETLDDYLEPYTSHDYISPHVQVSFPVTERTNFRLSYAQQVMTPDYSVALAGSNTDLAITNTNFTYGSDLDFGKTVLFEFGFGHAFSDDMVLDVAVYNKDNLANAAGRILALEDPRTQSNSDIRVVVNQDFGNTRGIDVRLDRRFGQIFNGVLAYTYQDAVSTGSDPYSYINFGSRVTSATTGRNLPPPQSAQPVDYSRPHSIAAQFAFNFPADFKEGTFLGSVMSRLGLAGTARYASGTAYTRCLATNNDGDLSATSSGTCSTLGGDFNAARLPAIKTFDLRLTKGFRMGGVDLTAYADMRNVFNFENIGLVFSQTGSIQNKRYQTQLARTDSTNFAQDAEANDRYDVETGDIDLPNDNAGCAGWVTQGGDPSAPTCYLLRKDEARFGNGDGVYSLAEQRVASDVLRLGTFNISRFAGAGRALRFGLELNF